MLTQYEWKTIVQLCCRMFRCSLEETIDNFRYKLYFFCALLVRAELHREVKELLQVVGVLDSGSFVPILIQIVVLARLSALLRFCVTHLFWRLSLLPPIPPVSLPVASSWRPAVIAIVGLFLLQVGFLRSFLDSIGDLLSPPLRLSYCSGRMRAPISDIELLTTPRRFLDRNSRVWHCSRCHNRSIVPWQIEPFKQLKKTYIRQAITQSCNFDLRVFKF